MSKLRVKLVKSGIDRPERQKRTLKALGLTKMQKTIEIEATPQVKGMVKSIQHLLTIEEI
jgi:large subunit ribosomal protein L30